MTEHRPFAAFGYALSAANLLAKSNNFRFFGVTVTELISSKYRNFLKPATLAPIMRLCLLILISFFTHTLWACSCVTLTLIEKVSFSDFIATAKIIKVLPDKKNLEYHDVEIQIIDIYKGKRISNLKIHSILNSSCSFYTSENSTWLIFASRDKNGDLVFGDCSGLLQIDFKYDSVKYKNAQVNYDKSIRKQLQVLDFLKNNQITPKNEYFLRSYMSNICFNNFTGSEVYKEQFAIYEFTINKDLTIKTVKAVKGFENIECESDLLECLKIGVKVNNNRRPNLISETRIMIALYMYPPKNGYKSFIGAYE